MYEPSMHGRSLMPLLGGDDASWRTDFLCEYFWERAFPQNPTVIGLRTDRYAYMRYHGIWDVDELYDIRTDSNRRDNLLGSYRLRNEAGEFTNRIADGGLQKQVRGFQNRIAQILKETRGRGEPRWKA